MNIFDCLKIWVARINSKFPYDEIKPNFRKKKSRCGSSATIF